MKNCRLVRTVWVCGFVLFGASLPGCGNSQPTGGLRGRITFRGEAVADAKIQVQSVETGAAAVGEADDSGNYEFDTPLIAGEYTASIMPAAEPIPAPPPPDMVVREDNPKIPRKYRDPATSGLMLKLEPGDNQFDVEMLE